MFGSASEEDLAGLDAIVSETGSEKIKQIIDYIKSIITSLKEKGYCDF